MINSLHVKNFKSLKDTKEIFLKNLNILTGTNGVGKSSLIQSLLLLRQSPELSNGYLLLNNDLVKIGIGEDALFQQADQDEISILLKTNAGKFIWNFKVTSTSDQLLDDRHKYEANSLNKISLFSDNFQYITADRIAQKEYHEFSQSYINKGFLGVRGQYAIHYLFATSTGEIKYEVPLQLRHHTVNNSGDLTIQTEAWLSEVSPYSKLSINKISSDLFQLGFSFGQLQTKPFKPSNVGFGLSYTLSVIVALLLSSDKSIIIIENPEAHLHPQAQSKLAELMARAANNGAQIIVETHSDHIINGTSVAIRKSFDSNSSISNNNEWAGISNEKVNIIWFEKDVEDSSANLCPIMIEPNAKIKHAPQGFFDQMEIDLKKILGFS